MSTPFWQWIILGVLYTAGLLLALGAIPKNRWIGIRTPRTLATDDAWYRAHRALGVVTLCLTLAITLLKLWPIHPLLYAIAGVVGMIGTAGAYAVVYRKYAV
jgi:hypothetical protein